MTNPAVQVIYMGAAEAAVDFRKHLLTDLETWLIDEDTHPDIAEYLLTGLTSWFEDPLGTEPAIRSAIPSILQAASLQSQEIGWYALLCGFIVEPSLVTCQQSYYSSIQCQPSRCWRFKTLLG